MSVKNERKEQPELKPNNTKKAGLKAGTEGTFNFQQWNTKSSEFLAGVVEATFERICGKEKPYDPLAKLTKAKRAALLN